MQIVGKEHFRNCSGHRFPELSNKTVEIITTNRVKLTAFAYEITSKIFTVSLYCMRTVNSSLVKY